MDVPVPEENFLVRKPWGLRWMGNIRVFRTEMKTNNKNRFVNVDKCVWYDIGLSQLYKRRLQNQIKTVWQTINNSSPISEIYRLFLQLYVLFFLPRSLGFIIRLRRLLRTNDIIRIK